MAATVEISETNGTSGAPTVTDGVSNINFGSADLPNITPAAHPIIIGQFSYTKWLRLHVSAMGGSTTIAAIKFWASTAVFKTGEGIASNAMSNTTNSHSILAYAQSTVETGSGAVTTPYNGNGVAVIGSTGWTAGFFQIATSAPTNPNVSIGGAILGSLAAPGYSDYIAIALTTTGSTPAGSVNQKIFTFQYNET